MRGVLVQAFGASVRGPRNRRASQPNQDAWSRARGRWGDLIVVCDGLGSRPLSFVGARAACRAATDAARLWPGSGEGRDPLFLVRLVEILWRLRVAPHEPNDCATTCAFALREPSGRLLVAGLGDGAAFVRDVGADVRVHGGRAGADFGNETLALGGPHRIADWWLATAPPSSGRVVVLATDGVSDDLDPERLDGFVDWLAVAVGRLPGRERWRELRAAIADWPVPNHVDDKTVAVLMERPEVAP